MNGTLMTFRAVISFAAVLTLLTVFVWALRRGTIRLSSLAPRGTITIETATAMGDRRQLAIVSVEGRRVLVGLTPTNISFITDLGAKQDGVWLKSDDRRLQPRADAAGGGQA